MLENAADVVRAYTRNRKDRLLAESTHLLAVVRDGRVVAALSCDAVNPLLGAAEAAAAGYGADALAIVVEGVFPMVRENPVTGKPWQRGEAESLWLEHDGVAKGWVSEAAITTLALRAGPTHDECWPFRVREGSVVWGAESLDLTVNGLAALLAARLDGPMLDPARVSDPGDGFMGSPDGPFYEPHVGRTALDIGCTRMLGSRLGGGGEAILIVDSAGRAEHVVSEGLPRWQVEVSGATMREDEAHG